MKSDGVRIFCTWSEITLYLPQFRIQRRLQLQILYRSVRSQPSYFIIYGPSYGLSEGKNISMPVLLLLNTVQPVLFNRKLVCLVNKRQVRKNDLMDRALLWGLRRPGIDFLLGHKLPLWSWASYLFYPVPLLPNYVKKKVFHRGVVKIKSIINCEVVRYYGDEGHKPDGQEK